MAGRRGVVIGLVQKSKLNTFCLLLTVSCEPTVSDSLSRQCILNVFATPNLHSILKTMTSPSDSSVVVSTVFSRAEMDLSTHTAL